MLEQEIAWLDKVRQNFDYDYVPETDSIYDFSPSAGTYIVTTEGASNEALQSLEEYGRISTTAGRVQAAEELLRNGLISDPVQYFNIINGDVIDQA